MPEPETKSFVVADVKSVDSKNPNGEFEAIISSGRLDRDNERFSKRAFDPLPDHITIDIDHGVSVAATVGSGKPYYEDDGVVKIKGTFSSRPIAQEVRTMVAEGHINKMSVAFGKAVREAQSEKSGGGVLIKSAELLNAAFVAVPSNIDAAVLAIKSAEKPEDPPVPEGKMRVTAEQLGLNRLTTGTTADATYYMDAAAGKAYKQDGTGEWVDMPLNPDDTKVGARLSKESMKALGRIHDECTSLGYDCSVAKDVRHMLEQHEAALRELRDDTEAEAKAAVEGAEFEDGAKEAVPDHAAALAKNLSLILTELRLGNTKRAESLIFGAAAHLNALSDDDTKSSTDPLADPLADPRADAPGRANGEEGSDVDEKATDLEQRNRAMQMRARVLAAEPAPA